MRIIAAQPMKNATEKNPKTTFLLDPYELIEVESAVHNMGNEVVGVYHSHPDHPAVPSPTDRMAATSHWLMVIVQVTEDKIQTRAWQLQGDNFTEHEIVVDSN